MKPLKLTMSLNTPMLIFSGHSNKMSRFFYTYICVCPFFLCQSNEVLGSASCKQNLRRSKHGCDELGVGVGGSCRLSIPITLLQLALVDASLKDISPYLGRCGLGKRMRVSQGENEADLVQPIRQVEQPVKESQITEASSWAN